MEDLGTDADECPSINTPAMLSNEGRYECRYQRSAQAQNGRKQRGFLLQIKWHSSGQHKTYPVVGHNIALRAHIFATTAPMRFVHACYPRRAISGFFAYPRMLPPSPTKKKRDDKIQSLEPCSCSCCASQTRKTSTRGTMRGHRFHRV